jgi:hypothetical protein
LQDRCTGVCARQTSASRKRLGIASSLIDCEED